MQRHSVFTTACVRRTCLISVADTSSHLVSPRARSIGRFPKKSPRDVGKVRVIILRQDARVTHPNPTAEISGRGLMIVAPATGEISRLAARRRTRTCKYAIKPESPMAKLFETREPQVLFLAKSRHSWHSPSHI